MPARRRHNLPENAGVVHFVNADLIASGMSPLKPEIAAITNAVLRKLDLRLDSRTVVNHLRIVERGAAVVQTVWVWADKAFKSGKALVTMLVGPHASPGGSHNAMISKV